MQRVATIQCAIELQDGVSPVLRDMGFALEQFSGRMVRFGEEMGDLAPDMAGIDRFGSALGGLAGQTEGAVLALDGVLDAGERITEAFGRMGDEVAQTFGQVERDAALTAARLPWYFAGPLGEIAGMFAGMAGSARASMSSVALNARAAMAAVSAVNLVESAEVARSAVAKGPGLGSVGFASATVVEAPAIEMPTIALWSSPEAMAGAVGVPDREVLRLPEPEVYLSGASGVRMMAAPVTVTVQNENYIGSEVDAEAVLREMELRLADAVASSMEGVYA